jgi:hypothetical protein
MLFSDTNECASNPCKNGGNCTDGIDSYTCSCVKGFTGTTCDNSKHFAVQTYCLTILTSFLCCTCLCAFACNIVQLIGEFELFNQDDMQCNSNFLFQLTVACTD